MPSRAWHARTNSQLWSLPATCIYHCNGLPDRTWQPTEEGGRRRARLCAAKQFIPVAPAITVPAGNLHFILSFNQLRVTQIPPAAFSNTNGYKSQFRDQEGFRKTFDFIKRSLSVCELLQFKTVLSNNLHWQTGKEPLPWSAACSQIILEQLGRSTMAESLGLSRTKGLIQIQ